MRHDMTWHENLNIKELKTIERDSRGLCGDWQLQLVLPVLSPFKLESGYLSNTRTSTSVSSFSSKTRSRCLPRNPEPPVIRYTRPRQFSDMLRGDSVDAVGPDQKGTFLCGVWGNTEQDYIAYCLLTFCLTSPFLFPFFFSAFTHRTQNKINTTGNQSKNCMKKCFFMCTYWLWDR